VIKHSTKDLKIADDPLSYLRQLTRVLFSNLNEVAREFVGLFAGNSGCCSVLLLWGSGELRNYVNLVLRHVFDPGPSLAVIGQAVRMIMVHCEQLAELGFDFTFEVEKLLTSNVEHVVKENGQNVMEATRMRVSEDKWKPYNLQSETNLNKFLEEMQEFGLRLDRFICDDSSANAESYSERCRIWLTVQTCHFARSTLQLAKDLAPLRLSELRPLCDQTYLDIWRFELEHIKEGLRARGKPPQQRTVAENCARFVVGELLPLCEDCYAGQQKGWTPLQDLLAVDFPALAPFRAQTSRSFEMIGEV